VTAANHGGPGTGEGRAPGKAATHDLRRRVISACVLAPLGLLATYLGGWVFLIVCLAAAGAMLWEWTVLVQRHGDPRILVPGLAALGVATLLVGEGLPGAAIGMIAIGALFAGGVIAASPRHNPVSNAPFWATGGVIYAGTGLIGPTVLRGDPELGLTALLYLFAIVWTTDIFAYFAGRGIGGPLLWPQVSPNKTWAGAIGGIAGGVAAGTLVAYASGVDGLEMAGVLAVVLSILAQGGDLFESAVKRRFGAKDASRLIPGHGGVMDRLDGFVAAALAAALIGVLHQSATAAARGLLIW
jgi:phosphatidate cytidylyltransferase